MAKSDMVFNAVIIGASSESIYAIKRAKQMGISVVALDGNPEAQGLKYADKGFTVDIRDYNAIYNILNQFSPKVVIPVPIGRYLISVGAVNDYYNLPGVSYKAATLCTDKHIFHKTLSGQKLREVDHILLSRGESNIPVEMPMPKYPIVTKPRYGSGSRDVRIYQDETDLKEHFLSGLPFDEDFIIEGFMEGKEYGVDAAIIDGVLYLILLREKVLTPYPYCQCVGYYTIIYDDDNAVFFESVETALSRAGAIVGLNNCLIHADIIRQGKDNIFIIELSARPSGHNLHNLFTPMATGVDMISEYLKFSLPQLNQSYSFSPAYTECMLISYFDLPEGHVTHVPDKENLSERYPIKAYECSIKAGDVLGRVVDGHSLMVRGYYVLQGTSRAELTEMSNEIKELFIVE